VLDLLPDALGKVAVGILQRFGNGEMLFERDLALHGLPPAARRLSAALILTRRSASTLARRCAHSPVGMVLARKRCDRRRCLNSGHRRDSLRPDRDRGHEYAPELHAGIPAADRPVPARAGGAVAR